METDVTSCLLEEKASSHDPVAFALPTPFLSLSLNLFEQYMITYIPRVYFLASFFFLIVLAHRRCGFFLRRVVVDESLCLSPGLFLCHLRCFFFFP